MQSTTTFYDLSTVRHRTSAFLRNTGMTQQAWQLENGPWVEPWKKLMKLQFRRRKNGWYTCEGQNLVYGFIKGKNHWIIRIYDPTDARDEAIKAATCASYTDCVDFCQRFENRATWAEEKKRSNRIRAYEEKLHRQPYRARFVRGGGCSPR